MDLEEFDMDCFVCNTGYGQIFDTELEEWVCYSCHSFFAGREDNAGI